MTQSATDEIRVTETLDTSGLLCPLPVFQAATVLGRLAPGDILELICTDPGSLEDIPALSRQRGDQLIASDQNDRTQRFWIQKGGPR